MKNILISFFCLLVVNLEAQNDPTQVCQTTKISVIIKEQILNPPPVVLLGGGDDFDNDGVPDDQELPGDCDNDDLDNWQDSDSDNDGFLDGPDNCPCDPAPNTPTGCPPTVTDKKVFWVHGYRGSELSWFQVGREDVMSRFKAQSYLVDYSATSSTLAAGASNVLNEVNDQVGTSLSTSDNFMIAHSMGGLVARTLGVPTTSVGTGKFNGLITFGTPHQGAAVANTLVFNEQMLVNIGIEACQALSKGPAYEGVSSIPKVGTLLNVLGATGAIVDATCSPLVSAVLPVAINAAKIGVEPELTTVNAPNIPAMATKHNAAFYGVENDDNGTLFPRFLGSILPIEDPTPAEIGPHGEFYHSDLDRIVYPLYSMGDNIDQIGMDAFAEFHDFYAQKRIQWHNTYSVNINVGTILNPAWGIASNLIDNYEYNKIAQAYAEGETFLNNFNHTWKGIIGALETEIIYTGDCQCTEYQQGEQIGEQFLIGSSGDPGECAALGNNDGMGNGTECSPYYVGQEISKPSDGFILAESAMNAPGLHYEPKLMLGSNHIQMRNDPNTKEAINLIFIQGIDPAVSDFFITEPR